MTCYLCYSKKHTKRDGKVRDNKNLEILECDNCGLVFLSDCEHIVDNYYEDSNMSKSLNIQEWLNETCVDDNRRFEFIKEMIINKDIADFGSGAGGFLIKAKTITKSVTGIELDNKIVEHYENNHINLISNINNIKDCSYDIITAFHVVEHLKDPITILNSLIAKLRKGGKIVMEVPNANDALLTIYKNKAFSEFTYWSPHLYLYNSFTLNLLFNKLEGNCNVAFIKYIQRYSLSNHLYWLSNDKPGGHQKWGNFIDSPELTEIYEAQLSSIGATDTIIAQIIKN